MITDARGRPFPLEDAKGCVNKGWASLIEEAWAFLETQGDVRVFQVKEKFGGLRIYSNATSNAATKFLDALENKSSTICEECGAPGKLSGSGWWRALCPAHTPVKDHS